MNLIPLMFFLTLTRATDQPPAKKRRVDLDESEYYHYLGKVHEELLHIATECAPTTQAAASELQLAHNEAIQFIRGACGTKEIEADLIHKYFAGLTGKFSKCAIASIARRCATDIDEDLLLWTLDDHFGMQWSLILFLSVIVSTTSTRVTSGRFKRSADLRMQRRSFTADEGTYQSVDDRIERIDAEISKILCPEYLRLRDGQTRLVALIERFRNEAETSEFEKRSKFFSDFKCLNRTGHVKGKACESAKTHAHAQASAFVGDILSQEEATLETIDCYFHGLSAKFNRKDLAEIGLRCSHDVELSSGRLMPQASLERLASLRDERNSILETQRGRFRKKQTY